MAREVGALYMMIKRDAAGEIVVRRVYEARDETGALVDVRFGEAIELAANEKALLKNVAKSLADKVPLGGG